MPAYAVAHLRSVDFGPAIIEYLQRIDATLEPYDGRFIVHGVQAEVMEGQWPGDIVVIAFPDLAAARAWYASPAYQAILALRTDHSQGDVILVAGCGANHKGADLLAAA
ncbi:DUF1330 domain-containing protein [Caulobacter sp. UNC279MFTsu5.1]|uniref:DUF1330 domain-containing protein n=1 Tax=Caulobacter sp. UNC279MFTsu5.1 TaxID=1502775 RepID=UPI0008F0DE78|nr:DUF1330 domain-containing protein [Caulobacter sp. UNC279MFTsu5.1]SFJ15945.1 Uncharacterized conserved protein, DUF1330 family [Caulobacter sp. UNC279MFTsu5.1]